jgi:hypothetical protein
MLSSLDVIWATRAGGGGRTERHYLDFVIDGVALCSQFSADFIPPLGWCINGAAHHALFIRVRSLIAVGVIP